MTKVSRGVTRCVSSRHDLQVPTAAVPHLLPAPALHNGLIRFCKRLTTPDPPRDFLGVGDESWPRATFWQAVAWKTEPGGCTGHRWPAVVPAPACDGLDPLSPLQVPSPPRCPPERLCAGDKGEHRDPLCLCAPWTRLFTHRYTRVHAARAAAEQELRRRHEADLQLACVLPGVSDGMDAWLCSTCFYLVRQPAVPLLLSSRVSAPVVAQGGDR